MRTFAHKQNQPHQKSSATLTRSKTPASTSRHETHPLQNLQRTIGNQAVVQLLRNHTDPEHQIKEALGTDPDTPNSIQSKETREIVSAHGAGEPLLPDARDEMEARFGFDLSRVRIHANDQTAAALGAKAFTNGHEISFRPGRSPSDRQLLTHEIAHVVQQVTGQSAHLHGAGGDDLQRKALEDQADNRTQQETGVGTIAPQSLKPLPAVSSPVLQFAFESDVLLELHRMPSAEEEGISGDQHRERVAKLRERVQRLHALFNGLSADEAKRFHERLKVRKRGDALSERFHDMLSHATRQSLLAVLESRMNAPVAGVPQADGPPTGIIRGDAQKVKISGLPTAQPNYADRSFRGLLSAPVGDAYTLCTESSDNCQNGISIPKSEFHLDDDPLTKGMTVLMQSVYPSRDVAEAVLAEMRVYQPKDMPLVTYYLRAGIIFPTTLSETTLPNLVPQVRAKRDQDRGDVKATADLAEDVAWWYVGARFPFRIKGGGGRGGGGGAKVPPTGAGPTAAKAAFNAVEVAEELFVATKSITSNVKKMLSAARQLSSMGGLTAAQKAEVMMGFFQKIGFSVTYVKGAAWVDEGLHLLMISEDGNSAFRFIKSTGEIFLGKLNRQTMQYVWGAIP